MRGTGPAFPTPAKSVDEARQRTQEGYDGMSQRTLVATHIMSSLVSGMYLENIRFTEVAAEAVLATDALLERLEVR